MPIYTNRILNVPKTAPEVKEAVTLTPAKPNLVTTTGTIPANVTEGIAKAPVGLALQHFPNAGGDAASTAQRTGLGVLHAAATRDDWDHLTRQAAVDRLKQADALAQEAIWLVAGRDPSHTDQVRAKVL